MKSRVRLFLGIPLPANDRTPLVALQEKVKPQLGGWRVVPAANWHVTVHFLGEVEALKIPPLEKWLRSLTVPKLPALTWNRWFAFPAATEATTAGLATSAAPTWERWAKELGGGLAALGFPVEKRTFVPHLTLFRRREGQPTVLPDDVPNFPFQPSALCLYESRVTDSGSVYTVRVEKALTQPAKGSKIFKEI